MVDVYHEFSHPEQMLAAIRQSLKPTGRVALVEFRAEDPNVPIKPLHKMTKEQILKEFEPNGFRLVEEFDKLPWQHLMFFERANETVRTQPGRLKHRPDVLQPRFPSPPSARPRPLRRPLRTSRRSAGTRRRRPRAPCRSNAR